MSCCSPPDIWRGSGPRGRTLQQFQRITFRKGLINNARFTPDGRNIIYEASWEGGPSRIYLAIPGNPNSRDLGIPPSSSLLAISSKEELAYTDASGNLMRGSISGGQMRPLLDNVAAADWSPDGEALAVLRRVNGKSRIEYPIGTVIADDVRFPLETIRDFAGWHARRLCLVLSWKGGRAAYCRPEQEATIPG